MKTAKHDIDEAEENSKPPAKRPRRKAALKSEERISELAKSDGTNIPDGDLKPAAKEDLLFTEDEERDFKPPAKAKSRRTTKKKGALKSEEGADDTDNDTPVVINFDAMVNVMEFLPPRSLFNITLTCKSLRQMVTTKMVVQSALIHGGSARTTMEELYNMTKTYTIHLPSPLRLLRLVNAKTCEFCFQKKTKHVRPGLGVNACWDCVSGGKGGRFHRYYCGSSDIRLTRVWKTSWVRYKKGPMYPTIFEHPRVATNGYGMNHYIWEEHRTDACGERIGPVVAWGNVDDLNNYYIQLRNAADAKKAAASSTSSSGNASAAAALEQAAPSLSNGDDWIDHYLTNTLNAPSQEDYAEFNDTVVNTVQMAERVSQEREELKKTKRAGTKQTKVAKVEKMLENLTALIDEPLKEFAFCSCGKENYLKEGTGSTRPCVIMETPFINVLLEPYIKSPSKMTKKAMKEIAAKINIELGRIGKLLEMDFLSDDDEFQAAAKAHFHECFPDSEAVFEVEQRYYSSPPFYRQNRINADFLKLIDKGRFFGALCYLMNNDLSPLLFVLEPSASLMQEKSSYLDETSLKNLAKKVWDHATTSARQGGGHADFDTWVAEATAKSHITLRNTLKKVESFKSWWEENKKNDANGITYLNRYLKEQWRIRSFIVESDMKKIVQAITNRSRYL